MVATRYGYDSPHLFLPKPAVNGGSKGSARLTGKVSENGQNPGVMGGSSPRTRPSAPRCGDTLGAWASFSPILGGDQDDLAPGSLSTGSPHGRALLPFQARRRLNVHPGLRKGKGDGKNLACSSVAVRDRGY